MVATLNGLAVDEDPPRWSVDDSLRAAAGSGPQYSAAVYLLARSPVFPAPPETGVERYLPESGGINVPKCPARRGGLGSLNGRALSPLDRGAQGECLAR